MLSKYLRPYRYNAARLLAARGPPQKQSVRVILGLVPPSQYDIPIPNKLNIGWVMKEYWETIPLFVTSAFAVSVLLFSIAWACMNKVDVVYSTRSRRNISRTMDLRNPSIHKLRIINQRYAPWPEMQDVLDKMCAAEKRALVRMQTCNI